MLVYDEQTVKRPYKPVVPYEDQDAVHYWGKHFANSLLLKFFLSSGTTAEKIQAQKELEMCERKMKFWEHHINFDKGVALKVAERLKKDWRR
jgi:hypothetical protein